MKNEVKVEVTGPSVIAPTEGFAGTCGAVRTSLLK